MYNFLQPHGPYCGWTSLFFNLASSTFDWLLVEIFWILCSFEAEAFIGQSRAWWFSLLQYKHKSSLRHHSFSFCNSFLKLEESLCIGLGFDALVGACFHGLMASFIWSLCRTPLMLTFKQSIVTLYRLCNGFYQYQWIKQIQK